MYLRKLRSSICISIELFRARMFGKYHHSVWNGQFDYHKYEWRGRFYYIPVEGGFDSKGYNGRDLVWECGYKKQQGVKKCLK